MAERSSNEITLNCKRRWREEVLMAKIHKKWNNDAFAAFTLCGLDETFPKTLRWDLVTCNRCRKAVRKIEGLRRFSEEKRRSR